MKKIILVLLCLFFSYEVNASTIVMDMDTFRILYSESAYEERLIASTTKIMTSLVVLNNVDDLNIVITIDESILQSTGSNLYLTIGEKIKVIDLLYGLMLRSGNDAAIILANYVGGSTEGFAKLMNETAASLGMLNTNFINSSGLENNLGQGNTSTCYDLAILMSHAMKNEIFRTITQTKEKITKTSLKTYKWTNKNKLLYDYKYTTGGKTGYTKKAYRTLVTTATKDSKNLVIVTLNESDDFNKHKNLYEKYFNKYKRYKLVDKDSKINKNKYIKKDIYMLLTEEELNNINISIEKYNNKEYLSIKLNDSEYIKEVLYTKSNNKKTILTKIKEFLWKIIS